jgi:hypothetical protein
MSTALLELVARYAITLLGAAIMYAFTQNASVPGARAFLKRIYPERKPAVYERLNAVIVIISGSAIGFLMYSPTTYAACLAAGFGWAGALNSLMRR